MKKASDIEIIRETIELFLVRNFDNLEMAGRVKQDQRPGVNYFSIDLNDVAWHNDLNKLHGELNKYLVDWAERNGRNFENYASVAVLTIEYLLPEKDDSIQNQSRLIRLYYLPSNLYRFVGTVKQKKRSRLLLKFFATWNNIVRRNVVIVSLPSLVFIILALVNYNDKQFNERLSKSFDYVNIASGIVASFVLGYLISKVLNIRQEKLARVEEIRNLSNEMTYFRNICFNLLNDHNFWTFAYPYKKSYEHGMSIRHIISYADYYYPDYDDKFAYAKYEAVNNKEAVNRVVLLILQLHMLSGAKFLDSGLTYTKFPPDYIYSFEEMQTFALFNKVNHLADCATDDYLPVAFADNYATKEILADMVRIDEKFKADHLTRANLEKISLDFQYRVIPRLYHLLKLNEADLPLTVKYFEITCSLILGFGIILPSICYVFLKNPFFTYINLFLVIAVIGHILLSLRAILNTENTLNRKEDYF